ncbi:MULTISPECIES: hypothetical protein [unclassified Leifsonia]|uniref:hypothetical protein n=1 Tax=unclassified Leifsonia TaxID=2663824 RepID=UPI0006FEB17E|nr:MULTISPECIES: hypothetical protein [unclassified Leifsonia]KQX05182.1 hypothetical protein ASC59_13355 [Leifsonia sp. Root1293]KRA08815.1 hypothetical protein ASD61_13355 [Leifsonia sp. Root60]
MSTLTERLAQSVPSWGARLAYGDKTTLDGHEILPVAVVVFGFGGGEGSGDVPDADGPGADRRGDGSGGGGGGYALPIGAYVGGPDGPVFRPNPIAMIAVAIPLVSAVGLALARLSRRSD